MAETNARAERPLERGRRPQSAAAYINGARAKRARRESAREGRTGGNTTTRSGSRPQSATAHPNCLPPMPLRPFANLRTRTGEPFSQPGGQLRFALGRRRSNRLPRESSRDCHCRIHHSSCLLRGFPRLLRRRHVLAPSPLHRGRSSRPHRRAPDRRRHGQRSSRAPRAHGHLRPSPSPPPISARLQTRNQPSSPPRPGSALPMGRFPQQPPPVPGMIRDRTPGPNVPRWNLNSRHSAATPPSPNPSRNGRRSPPASPRLWPPRRRCRPRALRATPRRPTCPRSRLPRRRQAVSAGESFRPLRVRGRRPRRLQWTARRRAARHTMAAVSGASVAAG